MFEACEEKTRSDDRLQIHGETEWQQSDNRREAESALTERLGRRPDRRVFKLSEKERWKLSPGLQPASRDCGEREGTSEPTCPFGHSEFNLGSVGSSDFVRLNPGPYLSTSQWRDGKGRRGKRRLQEEEDLQTMTLCHRGAKRLNEAREDKGGNKLDI